MGMSAWTDRNVFVTGATGLVGSWLVKYLVDEGANVTALVRDGVPRSILWSASDEFRMVGQRLNVVHGCLEDAPLLERAINEHEAEVVFHLGAQTIVGIANRNPMSTFEANVRGTWNLLEACRRAGGLVKAIVVASSDKAYGAQETLPYDEEMPLQGTHPYDVSKSCADLIAYSYFNTYGLPVCITRCGNFYGPGDLNFNRIIPETIRHILRGESPIIRSDGTYVRDYFYVKDGALAYKHLAQKMLAGGLAGESFNFSNEIQLTVLELVRKIAALMGSDVEPTVLGEARHEIPHQYLSARKAARTLGWAPAYTIDKGLDETIAWYRSFLADSPRG
jgi:CDP-glucose 4,6-dehydratase